MREPFNQIFQRMMLRRAAQGSPSTKAAMDPEMRAPGWQVRCTRCGFTEPWGKYGIRLGAASWKKYTVGRCAKCRRIGFHAIERTSASVT